MLVSGTIVGSVVPTLLLVITLCSAPDHGGGCMSGMGYAMFVVFTFTILYPAVFLGFIARRWFDFRSIVHAFVWGAIAGLTLAISWTVGEWILGDPIFMLERGPRGTLPQPPQTYFLFAALHAVAAALFWVLVRGYYKLRGIEILLQDGHTCPQCTYNLTGNISMVCPECGNPFTWDELSTPGEIA